MTERRLVGLKVFGFWGLKELKGLKGLKGPKGLKELKGLKGLKGPNRAVFGVLEVGFLGFRVYGLGLGCTSFWVSGLGYPEPKHKPNTQDSKKP